MNIVNTNVTKKFLKLLKKMLTKQVKQTKKPR